MKENLIKNRNTFNLVCYIKKAKTLKNGEAPIYMRITMNKQTADLSIQGSVNPNVWSQAKEQSRGKERADYELNHYIKSVKGKLIQIHRDLELSEKPITAQIVKDIYLGNKIDDKDSKTLVEIHSDHNERCRKLLGIEYSQSTIYKFDASLKYLKEFMFLRLKREDIALKEINQNFIRNYELYLKTEKGCANNSTIKHLKIFKKIIRIALLNDWLQKDPFVSVKFRQDEVHTEFLTMVELEILINKEISTKRLSQIRDVFVFCSFTDVALT